MSYDPRHPRAIDKIRFVLADTDSTSEFLPDGTYEQLLEQYSDDKVATARAAAATIEGIIRRIPVTRSANGESVSYAGQAEFYRRIATGETPLPLLEDPVEVVNASPFALVPAVFRATSNTDEYSR